MTKPWARAALAAGILAGSATFGAGGVRAASVTQPGQDVGLAIGAPLPEGLFVINTFSYGRSDGARSPEIGTNIPILVWSTPWKIFDARFEALLAQPSVFVTPEPAGRTISFLYNTFVGGILAWDLGKGFGVSYLFGAYLPTGGHLPQLASTTVRQGFAASYTDDGWNLTASLTYGLTIDPVVRYGGAAGAILGPQLNADTLNLDLTATKKFGKFEIGPVAFGSTDLPTRGLAFRNYSRAGQFAVGGLIGYDFGPLTVQLYVTRDVVNRDNTVSGAPTPPDTRGWFRVIAPLYVAGQSAAVTPQPLMRKY
ncbi:transporter [Methylorubrum extorquens]|uniref:CoxB-like protein n=1 Tax=Methylorubrum extorquens (strain CM4 / NCIMB 13688) TaxID=440085 RepID=B7L3K5_METC4|nr:transporter [Methylorubrum extorquens]ACK86413.1 conserved hypothetical protein [Methylorubrum extorquens CM4]